MSRVAWSLRRIEVSMMALDDSKTDQPHGTTTDFVDSNEPARGTYRSVPSAVTMEKCTIHSRRLIVFKRVRMTLQRVSRTEQPKQARYSLGRDLTAMGGYQTVRHR